MTENTQPEKPTESGSKPVLRDKTGRFVSGGGSANPSGCPRGRRTALMEIERAIEKFQKREGISYWEAATELAMELARKKGKTELLAKLIEKFLPSKIEADISARPYTMMPEMKLKGGVPLKFDVGDPALLGPDQPQVIE